MPQRPKHIPTHIERSALQWLRSHEWDIEQNLRPAGPNTIATMLEKGWIERLPDVTLRKVRITEAGQAALKVRIPFKR
jgi:hypothetical protein